MYRPGGSRLFSRRGRVARSLPARRTSRLDSTLGEPRLRLGDLRRGDARAACLGRHEKLVQLVTLEGAEAYGPAEWADSDRDRHVAVLEKRHCAIGLSAR
jgi:hypothetical protein